MGVRNRLAAEAAWLDAECATDDDGSGVVKRPVRLLLVLAPLLLLLIGVPLGVLLSQRAALRSAPEDATGGMRINVAATPTYAPRVDHPHPPTRTSQYGPPAPTRTAVSGPPAPKNASATATAGGTPLPISNAQTGFIGTVTSVDTDRFTVLTRARRTGVILVGSDTIIRFQNKTVTFATLRVGDQVTVLGRRDAANNFYAVLIRVVRPDATAT